MIIENNFDTTTILFVWTYFTITSLNKKVWGIQSLLQLFNTCDNTHMFSCVIQVEFSICILEVTIGHFREDGEAKLLNCNIHRNKIAFVSPPSPLVYPTQIKKIEYQISCSFEFLCWEAEDRLHISISIQYVSGKCAVSLRLAEIGLGRKCLLAENFHYDHYGYLCLFVWIGRPS